MGYEGYCMHRNREWYLPGSRRRLRSINGPALWLHETPILTVVMAQFVHELGMEWHLMSATAVIALVPALIVTLFGQRYVIRGLRI